MDDYEELHPGRRVVSTYAVGESEESVGESESSEVSEAVRGSSSSRYRVTVLDAPPEHDVSFPCAAMVVPHGLEQSWVYSSPGGQWQLLGSASVSRLILLSRSPPFIDPKHPQPPGTSPSRRNPVPASLHSPNLVEDELDEDKARLEPLVRALAPMCCFLQNLAIPFVNYTDDVVQCVIVEELESQLTGLMVVEDVELADWSDEGEAAFHDDVGDDLSMAKTADVKKNDDCKLSSPKSRHRIFRRRLRFKRMPNLIQSEVPLMISPAPHPTDSTYENRNFPQETNEFQNPSRSSEEECQATNEISSLKHLQRHPDYSSLVHKYLIPMLSGLYLISARINLAIIQNQKINVLVLGGGACTFPIFMHLHFPFHIKVVELDATLISVAERHFGLVRDKRLEIIIGDALVHVESMACHVASSGIVSDDIVTAWASSRYGNTPGVAGTKRRKKLRSEGSRAFGGPTSHAMRHDCETPNSASHGGLDPRVSVLVVDIDVGDGRAALSAPPVEFLDKSFLLSARLMMHDHGILIMNVMPWSRSSLDSAVGALKGVFAEVYRSGVEGDMNFVLFALPEPSVPATSCLKLGNVTLPRSTRGITKV